MTYALKGGDLTATGVGHSNAITPFSTGPLALPPGLDDPRNGWSAFVIDLTITGGTEAYKTATGSIRATGFTVSSSSGTPIWVNETDVVDIS